MTIDRFEARCERAHELLAEAAALLLRHAEPPTSRSGSYSGGSSSSDGESRSPLQTAVQGFETAITLAPHLRPVAWDYGVALLYQGRLAEAAEHFACCAALDGDDADPWLWRFLCIARQEGLAAARASLGAWTGCDMRLGMMDVLRLFKGEATLEQVLEAAAGDRYATARVSFAAALYFEARGDGHLAVPLLRAVAELDGDAGDGALRRLARCHLRVLEARLGRPAAEEEEKEGAEAAICGGCSSNKVVGEQEHQQEQEKGERGSFWGALMAGAWGGVRMPSVLDSSDGTVSVSSSGSLSSSRSWCGRSNSGSGDEGLYGMDDVEGLRQQTPIIPGRRARSCRH